MYVCVSEGREWGGGIEDIVGIEGLVGLGNLGNLGNLENLGNLGNSANFFRDFALIFKQNTQKFAHSRKKLYFCRKITR